jgi:hypothetical protein
MAAAQVDHLRPKIELSRGSRHIETIGGQNLLWPSVELPRALLNFMKRRCRE